MTAAVLGGLTVLLTDSLLVAATGDPQLARFASIILGGIVLELVATLLATITYMIRDEMSRSAVLALVIEDFGVVTLIEIGLIWVLTVAFLTVGWWAPLIVGALVLVLISRDREPGRRSRHGTRPEGPAGSGRSIASSAGCDAASSTAAR